MGGGEVICFQAMFALYFHDRSDEARSCLQLQNTNLEIKLSVCSLNRLRRLADVQRYLPSERLVTCVATITKRLFINKFCQNV